MFKIITQTDDFIVISKGAGVNFHDEGEHGLGLFSQLKQFLQQQFNTSELYPVHRLDKMTSGLLLFAKNKECATILGELFKEHKIEKYYLAISEKKPIKKQGLIKGDMAKSRRGMFKLMRTMNNPAITQFFSFNLGKSQRLYLLKPHSGKTHQLRVALNSIGVPIFGDSLYGSNQSTELKTTADRGYLHAYALRFEIFGKHYSYIEKPCEGDLFLSESFITKLKDIKNPWLLNWPKI